MSFAFRKTCFRIVAKPRGFNRKYSFKCRDYNRLCKPLLPEHCSVRSYREYGGEDNESPTRRALRLLKGSFVDVKTYLDDPHGYYDKHKLFPSYCDICVIGGGGIGSSIAYWLKERALDGLRVVVIEKDSTVNELNSEKQYQKCSTTLSVGGLRHQFSLKENIEMSMFGAEFIRNMDNYLTVNRFEKPPQVNFTPHGYLFLASESGAPDLETNSLLQASLGAKNVLLSPEKLKSRFPWINTDGIALGCLGVENEGWFDPWSLLQALKNKATAMGAEYVNGEVIGFNSRTINASCNVEHLKDGDIEVLRSVQVLCDDGKVRPINFSVVIIAGGPQSGTIASLAGVGSGKPGREIILPVEPRKRYVYCFHSPNGPGMNTPLTIDPTGTYFRREGLCGNYICGRGPEPNEEPDASNLDVDHTFFDDKVWPVLAQRVPAFENLKVTSSWAGFYDYNSFDQNVIIGNHPYFWNMYFCTGCSGHGIQQAPALGRAIMELIVEGEFKTIDLSRFSFKRLLSEDPIYERNIV